MSVLYNIKLQSLKYKKSFVTHKDIAFIYDNLSKTHYSSKSSGFLENYKNIFSYLELKNDARVLEIGCGNGFLSSFIPDYVHYLGIDISNKMINESLKLNKNNRKNISFEKIDAEDYVKFASENSYDLILFPFSWKYFDNNFQTKIFSILKEKGALVIVDDFAENYAELFKEFQEFKRINHSALTKINQFNYYAENTEMVNKSLNKTGYSQRIFLTFEKKPENEFKYLTESGIIPELVSEFGNASEMYLSKFEDFLNKKNFSLKNQKHYICIAKK
jgi:SAM-dependent methyltransferase